MYDHGWRQLDQTLMEMNMKRSFKIICLIMALTVTVAFTTACGETPSESAKSMLDSVKAQDTSAMEDVYAGNASNLKIDSMADTFTVGDAKLTKSQKKVISTFTKKLLSYNYKIISEKKDGKNATVKVKFTTYDFNSMLKASVKDFQAKAVTQALKGGSTSDTALTGILIGILSKEDAKLTKKDKTATVTLKLVKSRGKWKVAELSDKTLNGMYGGLLSAINQIQEQTESKNEK